jgi:hypothetical protein
MENSVTSAQLLSSRAAQTARDLTTAMRVCLRSGKLLVFTAFYRRKLTNAAVVRSLAVSAARDDAQKRAAKNFDVARFPWRC